MDPLVSDQVCPSGEALAALRTRKRRLSHVNALMGGEIGLRSEALPAFEAKVKFAGSVDLMVADVGGALREALSAIGTSECFLSGV